jgi:hypothetical protein
MGRYHEFGSGFSNRDGVGANVYLYESGHAGDPAFLLGLQQVEAKGGFSAQNAMTLTFGVQGQSHVDVEIHWPGSGGSAITQRVLGIAVGQKWLLREASGDCGDGVVDAGEICDTGIAAGQPGACPQACDSGDPCIAGTLVEAGACWADCEFDPITQPRDGDGCCPAGANAVSDDDCPPVCGNGVCEGGEDVSCITDCACADDDECDDSYVCTFDHCDAGICAYTPNAYGDADHNGVANLLDVFCILDGIGGDFTNCSLKDDDIEPCEPNGVLNLFDVFAVLDVISGIDPCCQVLP